MPGTTVCLSALMGLGLGALQAGLLRLAAVKARKWLPLILPLKLLLWALCLWGMARWSVHALLAFALGATCALWAMAVHLFRKARKGE